MGIRFERTTLIGLFLLLAPGYGAAQSQGAPSSGYRVVLNVERVDSLHWEALVHLDNAGPVAAATLPFRWGRGKAPYRIDSVNYRDLRTEYFAMKTFRVDSIQQTVLIGLISDLGNSYPPLESGDGPIARLFFTLKGNGAGKPLALDTTFVSPHNVLQLVTPDVRAIRPEFVRAATQQ